MNDLRVNECFYSLQGEGARAGEASVFIRLAGCDQTCGFCDTEFASGKEMSCLELAHKVSEASAQKTQWLVWTGGEPLLQLTEEHIQFFANRGYKQALETSGAHPVPWLMDWVAVSPKVAEHVLARNFPQGVDELRYAWHAGKTDVPRPTIKAKHYYLSPIFDGSNANQANLKHCIKLCLENPQWRLSIQQHKLLCIL